MLSRARRTVSSIAWFVVLTANVLASAQSPAKTPSGPAGIVVEAAKVGQPISKYVYGQFIEHLGRCIYGGIWAEMVEDRKFFHPVGAAESPWKPVGPAQAVAMVGEAFVGKHSPQVTLAADAPRGIVQQGLGVVPGKAVTGRIWWKGQGAGPIRVSLIWGDAPSDRQTVTIERTSPTFVKAPLEFSPAKGCDNARLEITAQGSGAFCIGTVSLMPADNVHGLRPDTLALLKELNAPIYRWPGGNFVSGYDWKDGIGHRDRRPPRKNPAWKGIEPNDFGLDEFLIVCRLLRTDPYIAVNTGQGNAASAAEEVQYANGGSETPQGQLRSKNGRPEPYGVKYWGVGNEMYGKWQLGHMPLDQYIKKHNEFAAAMRAACPAITLIGVGDLGPWSEGMLKHCAGYMDLMSEHFYCKEKADVAAHVQQIPDAVRHKVEGHRQYRQTLASLKGKDIRLALDEWNYWYGPEVFGEISPRFFVKDALGIAAGLNEMARQSDLVFMANYAQTVNVIGCIKTNKTAAAMETTGLVLALYRNHFGVLPVTTQSPVGLDAQAAWTADRKAMTVAIVHPGSKPLEVAWRIKDARLTGKGTRWQIGGVDPMAYNDPSDPAKVKTEKAPLEGLSEKITLAPCSVTLFSLDAQ